MTLLGETASHDVGVGRDGSSGPGALSFRDPAVVLLFLFVVLLQAATWWRSDGYQIADSVEFMEHASVFVHAEKEIDTGIIRPFGFASLLVPFFALADWAGIEVPRAVAWSICVLQICLALGLCAAVMRLSARLAGARAGWVGGFIAGTNPVFLQYSTQPLSGMAAALCIALAVDTLWERGTFRRGVFGGMWLAAAVLVAYQSLLIVIVLGILLLARDRWRHRALWSGALCAVLAGAAVQIVLDKLKYGTFGKSIGNYVIQNFGGVVASVLLRAGLPELAKPIYSATQAAQGITYVAPETIAVRALQGPWYYVENLPHMWVWPVLGVAVLGLLRSILRPRWTTTLLASAWVMNVAVMSFKGSKDFRLWLPLFAFVVPLCAYGWEWVAGWAGRRAVFARAAWTVLFVAVTLALNLREGSLRLTRNYAGYWRAMDFANECARDVHVAANAGAAPRHGKVRVAAAYNWAVLMRESALVDLVKLPHQLNLWPHFDAAKRTADLAALEGVDLFITHQPILTNNPDLMRFVNEHFEVRGAVYDPVRKQEIGPVYVLARRPLGTPTLRFFELSESASATPPSGEQPGMTFLRERNGAPAERLDLLGFQYRELPPDHHGWITYRWSSPTGISADYVVKDRITSPDELEAWQNDHVPAYGMRPTSTWLPGEVVSEGYLVVAATDPFKQGAPYRPVGGPHLHGDRIPVQLWIKIVELATNGAEDERFLAAARLGAATPLPNENQGEGFKTDDGVAFSWDNFVAVGQFFLPVHPSAKLELDAATDPQ